MTGPRFRAPRPATLAALLAALSVSSACIAALSGCGLPRAGIGLENGTDSLALLALSPAAKTCNLSGGDTAWFAARSPIGTAVPSSIEVVVSREESGPGEFSVAPVFARDLDGSGRLLGDLPPRPAGKVAGLSAGSTAFAIELPAGTGADAVVGFAVGAGPSETGARARILSAAVRPVEVGWDTSQAVPWIGFSRDGGTVNLSAIAANPPELRDLRGFSVARISVRATPKDALGVPSRPARFSFRSGAGSFGFRASPQDYAATVPLALIPGGGSIVPASNAERIAAVRVSRARDAGAPLPADPHMILEWPVSMWRDSRREVFSWDRFPSILIFDTADYAVQDRYFKRLAFFTEKKGFRGRLASDAEIASLHGFNAHDYRAESLAAFFEMARTGDFPLGAEERELLDILLARGIVVREGRKLVPGEGAVLSVSRESVAYLRHLFMTHECLHGVYFADPAFRAVVSDAYARMDPTAVRFLREYFSIVPGLEYDPDDAYLMENEFMAYVLQQPVARVGEYFSKNILERYLRHGGSREVGDHIARTGGSDFVKAAETLEAYCFDRWGFAAGRVGLWFSSGSSD